MGLVCGRKRTEEEGQGQGTEDGDMGYRDISEMIVLVRCSGASDSNLSKFLHVFSSLNSASTSAGDFFNCCCNYHKYIELTKREGIIPVRKQVA